MAPLPPDGPAREDGGKPSPKIGQDKAAKLRKHVDARLTELEQARYSWWQHWRDLADYILPRRYRWLVTANQWNKGAQINQRIINSTGTTAARNAAAGIMSGTTSPSRPWFRLSLAEGNDEIARDGDVQIWLEEATRRMLRVMAGSNYYGAKAVQYLDLVVFGTAPLIIYPDRDSVIRCFNPAAGEYYCAVGPNFDVNTLYRKFTMTVQQIVDEFGIENASPSVKSIWDTVQKANGSGAETEIEIGHAIEPNPDYTPNPQGPGALGVPRHFRFREYYWESGSTQTTGFLRATGYLDQPFSCPRWDVIGNDAYGRSPGMDALGDIKQLQQQEKRKAQGIDKIVNPPMVADASMKNQPASLLPGAVTYVPALTGGVGFKPAFTSNMPIGELKEDIAKVEARIKDVFFNDLFLMISQLDTVRTATEIDARREEKLVMLGPAMDRLQREGLAADIRRIFNIMARTGMFPQMPEIMQRADLKIEYISLLADLQRATATTAIERLWGFAGNIGGALPTVLDNLDADATIEEYASLLRVSPRILTSKTQRDQIRQSRAQAEQQQKLEQDAQAAVGGAKVLSETNVGGGQNALQMMLNGGM
jgi:hypothetical protein